MITAKKNNPSQTSFLSCFKRADAEFLNNELGDTTVLALMDAEEKRHAQENTAQQNTE